MHTCYTHDCNGLFYNFRSIYLSNKVAKRCVLCMKVNFLHLYGFLFNIQYIYILPMLKSGLLSRQSDDYITKAPSLLVDVPDIGALKTY